MDVLSNTTKQELLIRLANLNRSSAAAYAAYEQRVAERKAFERSTGHISSVPAQKWDDSYSIEFSKVMNEYERRFGYKPSRDEWEHL